jgi:hypothetical protein
VSVTFAFPSRLFSITLVFLSPRRNNTLSAKMDFAITLFLSRRGF